MNKTVILISYLYLIHVASSAFTSADKQITSYWFDLDGVFQAGPSDPVKEIKRIDIPDLQLTTSGCSTCILYEVGYTSLSPTNTPAGNNNQKIYCNPTY